MITAAGGVGHWVDCQAGNHGVADVIPQAIGDFLNQKNPRRTGMIQAAPLNGEGLLLADGHAGRKAGATLQFQRVVDFNQRAHA